MGRWLLNDFDWLAARDGRVAERGMDKAFDALSGVADTEGRLAVGGVDGMGWIGLAWRTWLERPSLLE